MTADISEASPTSKAANQTQRTFESHELFRGENEILITHDGAVYRMKITRQGKLILNK